MLRAALEEEQVHCTRIAWMTRGLFPCLVVIAVGLVATTAAADAKTEKEAAALQRKAVQEDFLNVDYPAAIKKLHTAVNKCGANKCGPALRGALLRDLGAMQILGGAIDEGKANFAQALAADSSLDLDPAYKNPQLEAAWSGVKKGSGGGGAGGGGETAAGGGGTGAAAGGGGGGGSAGGGSQPSGDFTHSPVPEQAVRTPLPIYVEYSGTETLKKVVAKYKATGMSDWKPVELQKMGDGWGGLVPCKDITTPGKMQYYLQGFSPGNDPVATGGSRNKPYTVSIKATIEGPEPSLPGKDAPKQCGELAGAECPPDFPGCSSGAKKGSGEDCDKNKDCQSNSCVGGKCEEKKAGGEDCEKDDECSSRSCTDGKCKAPKKDAGEDCETSDECDSGTCKQGKCEGGGGGGASSSYNKMWGGIGASMDLFFVPGQNDVCRLNAAGTGPPSLRGARTSVTTRPSAPTFPGPLPSARRSTATRRAAPTRSSSRRASRASTTSSRDSFTAR